MMVAGIAMANPEVSLRAIGAQLEAMRERTPRGGRQWAASSVKNLLDQAEKLGLAPSIGNRVERNSADLSSAYAPGGLRCVTPFAGRYGAASSRQLRRSLSR